jgi:hypothetical protein
MKGTKLAWLIVPPLLHCNNKPSGVPDQQIQKINDGSTDIPILAVNRAALCLIQTVQDLSPLPVANRQCASVNEHLSNKFRADPFAQFSTLFGKARLPPKAMWRDHAAQFATER